MITHTRPQVMYSLDIASTHRNFSCHNRDVLRMAEKISELTGGCTLIGSTGLWADVERADKETYTGYAVGTETNVQLQVKAEVSKEAKVEKAILESIVELAERNPELEINWVCGHKVTKEGLTIAFNFSVEENK